MVWQSRNEAESLAHSKAIISRKRQIQQWFFFLFIDLDNLFRIIFVLHFSPRRSVDIREDDSSVHRRRRAIDLLVFQIQVQLLDTEEDRWAATSSDLWQFVWLCCDEEKTFRRHLSRNLQVSLTSGCKWHEINLVISSYPTARYVGFYKIDEPALLIRDLEIVKDILVTKFNIFNKNDFAADAKVSKQWNSCQLLAWSWITFSWIHFLLSIRSSFPVTIGKRQEVNLRLFLSLDEFALLFHTSTTSPKL